jgi:hypothetical protein
MLSSLADGGTKSLESLPFPSNYFDFVRGVGLSFHVPEDEVRNMNYKFIFCDDH